MSTAIAGLATNRPSTAALVAYLRPSIEAQFGAGLVHLSRTPSLYSTSFAIEILELTLTSGSVIPIVFKNLSSQSLLPQAQQVRPAFVYDATREIDTYRSLLAGAGLGTAHLFASESDSFRDRHWLFLEKVNGVELYQVGELETWKQAARWLGTLHEHFGSAADSSVPPSLLRYGAGWYRRWMRRAMCFAPPGTHTAMGRLNTAHDAVVEHLCDLPTTLIHGDLYASNVLASGTGRKARICAVDWELASVGPGWFDLAGLVTGWSASQEAEIVKAYCSPETVDLRSLAMCRLQLCIQWLGWSPGWTPPAEHRQDWLGDAMRLIDELEV